MNQVFETIFISFSWNQIAFLAVLNIFPVQKIDFWPFLKLQKMEFGQKKFSEIDLFGFTSFFCLDFFLFFLPAVYYYVLEWICIFCSWIGFLYQFD